MAPTTTSGRSTRSPPTTKRTRATRTSTSRTRKTRSPSLPRWRSRLQTSAPRTDASTRRARVMRIASTAISVVFLGAAAWWVSKQKMPTIPSGTHAYLCIAGALALYALATLCRGERWHQLLRQTSIHPKRIDSYAITTVGYAGNNTLPARAGEAMRVFLVAGRVDASKREVLGTIIAERVLDASVLAIAFAFGAYGTLVSGSPMALLGIIVVGIAAVLLFPSRWHPSPSHPRLRWLIETVGRLLRPTRS